MHYMEEDVMSHRNEQKVPPSGEKSLCTIKKNLGEPRIFFLKLSSKNFSSNTSNHTHTNLFFLIQVKTVILY